VSGGRVTTLEVDNLDDVTGIRIIDGPAHGNLTVNPDNSMALVMSMDHTFSGNLNIAYEVAYSDGSTQTFNDRVYVQPTTQAAGWNVGSVYALEEDANGDLIVETGENHRDIFVSGSNDALTIADIAALENISTGAINGRWLANHPEYGGTEGMALATDAAKMLWDTVAGQGSYPSSNWLLFEKGYEYNLGGTFDLRGTTGEDPLHPVHITSYGVGEKPIINSEIFAFSQSAENVVISNLDLRQGASILEAQNVIFNNVDVTNDGFGIVVQDSANITVRDSFIYDSYQLSPPGGGSYWAGNEFASGLYVAAVDGLLVEGSLFDHNGWADDYRYDLSAAGGRPPNMFSHNVYIDANNEDVTFRDNISMRGAATGAQLRSGAFIEDNLFLDNNVAANFHGGDSFGAGNVGNFSLFTDNVITSAGYKTSGSDAQGALSFGVDTRGNESTLLDNIIAHMADPNNPSEIAEKTDGQSALHIENGAFYDDTIIHNWVGSSGYGTTGVNTGDLDTNALNATTIQYFAQQLLGDPNATIGDLADFLRAQAAGDLDNFVDADLIINFFQTGFGLSVDGRVTADTLRFVPNDLGDGIRWDNRLNWDSEDLPGTVNGDSVDLGGNWVTYGGTTRLDDLDFGNGGTLVVDHGYLQVNGQTTSGANGALLDIDAAGQVWLNGYGTTSGRMTIDIDGGRFANTGLFDGAVSADIANAQFIFASDDAEFIVRDGSTLDFTGAARTGFDGENGGTAVLLLDDNVTLNFDLQNGHMGSIEEFRSGAFGDNPNVQSGVNLGGSSLSLDIAGWGDVLSHTLIDVDDLIGTFDDLNIVGLAGNRDAEVVINYDDDTVTLNVTARGGSGQYTMRTVGDETNAQANDDLWAALNNGHGIYSDGLS
jgi:hypothetical protein